MLVAGIKSRPVYKGLTADPHARYNIVCAEADGAAAVLEMAADAPPEFMSRTTLLFAAAASGRGYKQRLEALQPYVMMQFPTVATLLVRLDGLLDKAMMGTRLYVSGTEGFIGECMQLVLRYGIDQASIRTEHRGSEMRRVQCVHCKGITGGVTTNPAQCSHCGIEMLVRDHYSRRIGAFQGVCVDAEVPGELPPVVESFR